MKITAVKTRAYTYRYKDEESYGNGVRWSHSRSCVIVEVQTDEGITGYGESDCAGGPPGVTACIVEREIAPKVVGMDPMCVEAVWNKVYFDSMIHGRRGAVIQALSGVDVALWDIMGKALGQPVYRLLGGAHSRLEAYHSGGFYHHDDHPAREAEAGLAKHYRGFKIKIGRYTMDKDLERVAAVRRAIGPGCKLMADANSAYSVKEAIQMARKMEEYDLFWFEEPVGADDPQGSAKVAAGTALAIAGYETEHTLYGFRTLIDAGAVDIVQCDAIRSGGFTECRKVAAYAQAHKLPCTAHIFSSGLSLVANMHFVAGLVNCGMVECDANPYPLRTRIFRNFSLQVEEDGMIPLPEGAGLGVEMDFEAIEPWRIG